MVCKAKVISYFQSLFSLSYDFVSNNKNLSSIFHQFTANICPDSFVLVILFSLCPDSGLGAGGDADACRLCEWH